MSIKKISNGRTMNWLDNRNAITWLDKLNFSRILAIWIVIILVFGACYLLLSSSGSFLSYPDGTRIDNYFDAIYFSFVAATTTGFGDVLPNGLFKVIAIFEVVFGLLLLALVTSRLVSIKQDAILNEVYEISFNERINRMRSSLLLFRQNTERLVLKAEEKTLKSRDFEMAESYIYSLRDVLEEILSVLFKTKRNSLFVKKLDHVNSELIFNSVLSSFSKLNELFELANENKVNYSDKISLDLINNCIKLCENIFVNVPVNAIGEKKSDELVKRKDKLLSDLTKNIK